MRMATELFTEIMAEGRTFPDREGRRLRILKGLPEGAKLVSMSMHAFTMTDEVALKFSHPSWDDVPPGTAIPEAPIEYTMELVADSASYADAYAVMNDLRKMNGLQPAGKPGGVVYVPKPEADGPHIVGG